MKELEERIEELIQEGEKKISEEKYKKALKHFNDTLLLNPECKEAWYGKGTANHRLRNDKTAITCYKKALAFDPDYIGPLKGLAWILQTMDKLEQTIECYNRIINIKPTPMILTRKGDILTRKGDILTMGGDLFFSQKKYEEAIKCYEQALNLDPYFSRAISNKRDVENKIKFVEAAI